ELGPGAEEAVAALGVPVAPLLEARGFTGKAGEAAALPTLGRLEATVLLLVGVGERDKVDAEVLRRAAAAVVRQGRGGRKAVTTLAQALPAYPETAVQAVTEGALLAAYRFDKYKRARAAAGSDGRPLPAELATLAAVPAAATGRGSAGGRALTPAASPGPPPTSRPTPCTRPTWPPPPASCSTARASRSRSRTRRRWPRRASAASSGSARGPSTRRA